jgi:hypothetical protein
MSPAFRSPTGPPEPQPPRGGARAAPRPRKEWAPGRPERRSRARGRLSRLLTSPLSPAAVENRARRAAGPVVRRLWLVVPLLLAPALGYAAIALWLQRAPTLTPRHRAEALCFALAQPPGFDPPMRVEPTAALVRGRFTTSTPASVAVQQVMHFEDPMRVRQWTRHVGDYDVCAMWLRLPDADGVRSWLIVAWMEGADLAVCSFRFAGDEPELTPDQIRWGKVLLARLLVPRNFDAARLPAVKLRAPRGSSMPAFGPPERG